uniref:Uncharacterized protein n=1 Tax=Anguilla anguilla TaxID=7936 RepID=A0A0E9S5E3_ANGAN
MKLTYTNTLPHMHTPSLDMGGTDLSLTHDVGDFVQMHYRIQQCVCIFHDY